MTIQTIGFHKIIVLDEDSPYPPDQPKNNYALELVLQHSEQQHHEHVLVTETDLAILLPILEQLQRGDSWYQLCRIADEEMRFINAEDYLGMFFENWHLHALEYTFLKYSLVWYDQYSQRFDCVIERQNLETTC